MTFQVGTLIPQEVMARATRETLKAYAEASGDPNPIHLDDEAAKKAGLPSIIAHGMLVAGWVSERAKRWMFREGLADRWRFESTRFRFRAMTLLDDSIAVGGVVKQANESELVLDLEAKNPRGEVVIQAHIVLTKQ